MVKKNPLMSRVLLAFMGTMILANIAGMMYRNLLPLYLQTLGADVGQIGLFFTLSAIAPLLFQILGGWLSDTIGRLQAVAIGSVAGVLGYVVYLVSPSWEWLLLAMVTGAVAGSFVAPSFQAFIAEQTSQENLGKVYGLSEGLFAVVGVIGPPLGGIISDRYGYKMLFLVSGVLYLAATVIRLFMARKARKTGEQTAKKPTFAGLKSNLSAMFGLLVSGGVVTWLMISDGAVDVSFSLVGQLEPLYVQNQLGITNTQIGFLSSIGSIVTMALMTAAGWLSDKKGERVGIVLGFAMVAFGFIVFLLSSKFQELVVSWVLFGMGQALISPAFNSLVSKVVPTSLRGTAFGLFTTSLGLISLPAPFIGGLMWKHIDPRAPFIVPIVVTLALLPLMWVKFKLPPKASAEPETVPVDAAAD